MNVIAIKVQSILVALVNINSPTKSIHTISHTVGEVFLGSNLPCFFLFFYTSDKYDNSLYRL